MPGRILVVGSDEAIRIALRRALRAQGVEADELLDGSRAVDTIRTGRYQIVLLDLRDGFPVLSAIREDAVHPVVIVLSDSAADVQKLAGDSVVTLSISKTFIVRNIEPVIAAIAAVSRMG